MQKLLLTLTFGLSLPLAAQAQTWVGGTGNNVTTAANWFPSGAPVNNGTATLTFGTTGNSGVNFDIAYSVGSLGFSGSTSYSLNGSALTIGSSGITTTTVGVGQFINNALTLGGSATFATTGGGAGSNLTFTGTINNAGNTLTLNSSNSALSSLGNISGAGALIVNGTTGGAVFLSGTANTWSGVTTINSGATLQFGDTTGNSVSIPGDISDNGTLNIKASASSYTYSGAITGSGRLQVLGTNTLTLTGANTYTGGTLIGGVNSGQTGGTLKIGATNALPTDTALSFGVEGSIITLDVAADQMIAGFNGTNSGAVITIESGKTLTISPVSANTTTAFSGAIGGTGGALVISGQATARTRLQGSSTFTGGTTVHSGTLELDNTSGSGLGTGPVTIDSGAMLVGKGNAVTGFTGTLSLSGTMQPSGTLAAGATTINPGARYSWLLANTAGAAGTVYGVLNVTGSLTLNATALSPFVIAPLTFTPGAGPTLASNFDTTQNYSFTLATSTTGVSGFNANAIAFDMSGFQNAYTGTWAVAVSGNNLLLNYTGGAAIPEPAVSALFVGLSGLGVVLWRKRNRPRRG